MPRESNLPLRVTAIEMVRSCGGIEPSGGWVSPPRVTLTGAAPCLGSACGAILPVKETRRLPSWVTSAWAREEKARRKRIAAGAAILFPLFSPIGLGELVGLKGQA